VYTSLLLIESTADTLEAELGKALERVAEKATELSRVGESSFRTFLTVALDTANAVINVIGATLLPEKAAVVLKLGALKVALYVFRLFAAQIQKLFHLLLKISGTYKKMQKRMSYLRYMPYKSLPLYIFAIAVGALIGIGVARLIWGQEVSKAILPRIRRTLFTGIWGLYTLLVAFRLFLNALMVQHSRRGGVHLYEQEVRRRLANSPSKVARALARAYDLAKTIVPELDSRKMRAVGVAKGPINAFCLPLKNPIIGMFDVERWEKNYTEEELVAVLLHEIGHAVTLGGFSLLGLILHSFLGSWGSGLIAGSGTTQIVYHIVVGMGKSFRSMRRETWADNFAVRLGYGKHLKSSLVKLRNYYKTHSRQDPLKKGLVRIMHTYVPHLVDIKTRLKMIDTAIKAREEVIKQTYKQQIEKSRAA